MKSRNAIMNRALVLSPWLTLAMLLGMSHLLPNRSEFSPDSQTRKAQVARAMESVPMFIGRWVGQDKEVPKEAQKLLRPNAILSRIYTSAGAPTTWVVVVHCSDARDMIGHYPPICYPSAGWREDDVAEPDCNLTADACNIPVHQYRFSRVGEGGRPEMIRIFNAFILPDGRVTRQIEEINRQSERLAVSVQGVAQLQVITSATTPLTEAIDAANEILGGMSVMLDALKVGQGASREN